MSLLPNLIISFEQTVVLFPVFEPVIFRVLFIKWSMRIFNIFLPVVLSHRIIIQVISIDHQGITYLSIKPSESLRQLLCPFILLCKERSMLKRIFVHSLNFCMTIREFFQIKFCPALFIIFDNWSFLSKYQHLLSC
jgi:hypothetical protein